MEGCKQFTKKVVHRILRNGTRDEILELLKHKTDLNYVSEDVYDMGDTVLHAILRNEKLIERHVTEIFTVLLNQGVGNPNIANKHEQTSLHLAVERRMKDVVDLLLEFEADVHAVSEVGDSIAHFFVNDEFNKYKEATLYPIMNTEENRKIKESCSVSFLEFLIRKGIDFDRPNKGGKSALYSAIKYQLLHILPTLFEHTKDIKFVDKDKTLLHYFLEERSLNLPCERPRFNYNVKYATRCVRVLLNRQVPILDCEKYGCTLISEAIKNKEEMDVIETLINYYLSHYDDVKLATTLHNELLGTSDDWSPSESEYFLIVLSNLETKITNMNNKVQQNKFPLIIKNKIQLNKSPLIMKNTNNSYYIMRTPLHDAVMKNEAADAIDLLLTNGADVNAVDSAGNTPLHLAVCNNDVAVALLFLQNGALVNCRNSFRRTPLHSALLSENVSMQMVELLLSSGAKVNTKDYKGTTPLQVAVFENNPPIVRLLIEHGAYVMCSNKCGQTPLHCAVIAGSVEIVELLLANGADANAKDCKGNTPLHHIPNRWTLTHSSKQILKMLLEKGAHVEARNDKGETAFTLARTLDNNSLADELVNYGDLKVQCLEHPCRDEAFQDHNDYLIEIKKLQITAIGNHRSLFDFLMMHPKRRCTYTKSEQLKRLIDSPKLHELFPIYSCIILARYQEAVTRKSLEESAEEALYAMTQVRLPYSVDKILAHLENEDLIRIALANLYDDADDDE